jgi:histone deacetylase 6
MQNFARDTKEVPPFELQLQLDEEEAGLHRFSPIKDCPHVSLAAQDASLFRGLDAAAPACSTCGASSEETWVCLTCGSLGCSRYEAGHAALHGGEGAATGGRRSEPHVLALSLADLSVWCYACEAYMDVFAIPELRVPFRALHVLKFGEPPVMPAPSPSA